MAVVWLLWSSGGGSQVAMAVEWRWQTSGGGGGGGDGGGVAVERRVAIVVVMEMAVEVVRSDHLISFWNIIPTFVGSQ